MKKINRYTVKIGCRCPFESCRKYYDKTVTIEYTLNSKGDVVNHRVLTHRGMK